MKKIFYTAIVLIFVANCSSPANVESNVSNKNSIVIVPTNAATNRTIAPPSDQTAGNVANSTDAKKVTVEDLGSVSRRNVERVRSKGKGDANAPPIPATAATPNPAADNSEISSTMNSKGVPIETRVFKNHPVLAKIERTFEVLDKPVMKVYLKNGKVLTAPPNAIANPLTATADEILRAAVVNR